MKTLKLFICLVLSAIVLAVPEVASAQGRWWQSERFQKELGLTKEQISRIEAVYQSTTPLYRAQKEAFDRREEKLSKILADPKSDEADRKSTRLNSSHGYISYAVFCLKK